MVTARACNEVLTCQGGNKELFKADISRMVNERNARAGTLSIRHVPVCSIVLFFQKKLVQ